MKNLLYKTQNVLNQEIDKLENKVLQFPDGKLLMHKDRNGTKWFYASKLGNKYLSKKRDKKLAASLMEKDYYQSQLDLLIYQKELVETCIKAEEYTNQELENKFSKGGNLMALMKGEDGFQTKEEAVEKWKAEEYETSTLHPENKRFRTKAGIMVRSKSEQVWANLLYENNIPFRYEERIELNGAYYYPDFTVLIPSTMEVIYIEHFGMMDNSEYYMRTMSKIQTYIANHIMPTVNLICTYESREYPLDPEYVQGLIELHFLK